MDIFPTLLTTPSFASFLHVNHAISTMVRMVSILRMVEAVRTWRFLTQPIDGGFDDNNIKIRSVAYQGRPP